MQRLTLVHHRRVGFIVAFAWLALLSATSVAAQVKPGDVISPENATKVKDITTQGVYYMVTKGMQLHITSTQRVDWPPPYKDATEKYSSQVRLSQNHRTVVGYVAGQPFPLVDANDPDIANKIIWNNVFRPITTDDYDLRFYDCQSQYVKPGATHNVVDDIQVGHYAGYSLVGRTEVEPLPADPDFKVTNRLWLFALYPILAPQDARGTGLIRYRYADPNRGDDSWTWEPGSRRLRRLNEAILSSATGAQAFDPIIIRVSTRRSSFTITNSWVKRKCSYVYTPPIRPRLPARPMVALPLVLKTGR
jgi:hypothetical protein